MADEIFVSAETREETGSGGARRLRREGWLPGVLNLEKGDPTSIKLSRHDFELMLHHHSGDNLMVDLDLDGKKLGKVFMKDVQVHPLTGDVMHVDFFQVSMTKQMRVTIPVVLVGEPDGVANEGGILEQMLREVEVECLPGDMVESFELDVSGLGIGDSLRVEDIPMGGTFSLVTAADVAVAGVAAPRVEAEPVAGEGEEGEGEGEEGAEAAEGGEEGAERAEQE